VGFVLQLIFEMDAGTISAIAALVVAVVALVIAVAQVAQQYIATADLMRKCDSIVYGYLPGKGRGVWVMRQLRFKVVYSIPQISLPAELWPSRAPFIPSYSQVRDQLPWGIDAMHKSAILSWRSIMGLLLTRDPEFLL
jgi:hypothetical protein